MSMCVLVPSRGRPDNIYRLARAWESTGAEAHLVVLVDSDDPQMVGYRAVADRLPFELVVGAPSRIGPILNGYAPQAAEDFDVIGFMGDDHLPGTERWDMAIAGASTPWTVVYGNDLLQGERLATAVFIGSGIIRTLGYFVPPGLKHLYFEHPWMAWGRALGTLRYLPDVVIEHLHFINGKAPADALYAEVNSGEMYAHDREVWERYERTELAADVDKLRAASSWSAS